MKKLFMALLYYYGRDFYKRVAHLKLFKGVYALDGILITQKM